MKWQTPTIAILLTIQLATATNLAMDTKWLQTHQNWKKNTLQQTQSLNQITITCQKNPQVNGYYRYYNLNKAGTTITATITIYNACQLNNDQLTEVWQHELKHHQCKMNWINQQECQDHWQI